jgi:hypothetical protein
MKSLFPWFFVTDADYAKIWQNGILTVDANVLLDLYRYHTSTRDALLAALESFKGRIWISHQTASEFLRNRKSVIVDMTLDFERSSKPIDDLKKAILDANDRLKSHRVIPKSTIEEFGSELDAAITKISKAISTEKSNAPDYLTTDQILDRLIKLLEGNISGKPGDLDDALKEATRRKSGKIPPGYMDKDKDGDRHAGDYFMWREILSFAKAKKMPVIFVTSERKEDWWEIKSGRTLGPRHELLQEAQETSGQGFAIYHTDRFLEFYEKSKGQSASTEALAEIREIAESREASRLPAVSVVQEVLAADEQSNKGILHVRLARPVRNFTGSGHFEPRLRHAPRLEVKVISTPEGVPDINIRANTGTNYDFNAHIHAFGNGSTLPPGEYLIEYSAICSDIAVS